MEVWESGVDFTNENYYQENVVIDNIKFTNNTKIRLMCSASANADQIFIDDINVLKCSEVDSSEQDIKVSISDKGEELNDLSFEALQQKNAHGLDQVEIEIYPNPSQDAVLATNKIR